MVGIFYFLFLSWGASEAADARIGDQIAFWPRGVVEDLLDKFVCAQRLEVAVDARPAAANGDGEVALRRVGVGDHGAQQRPAGVDFRAVAIFGRLFRARPQRRQVHLPALGIENVGTARDLESERDGLKFEAAELALPV
jgi:hypothetical protein